jgi:GntR family transcriptional regulator/MocR family aminotransferase
MFDPVSGKNMEPVLPFDLVLPRHAGRRMQTLHRALRAAILDGRLARGFTMPSTRRLAEALRVSRNTVSAAYDLLMAEGYLSTRTRARPVVAALARPARSRIRTASPAADTRIARFWRTPYLPARVAPNLPERSFRLGIPEYRQFPHALWRRLVARALRAGEKQPFRYPPAAGLPALRDAIARHVAFTRAVACTADDVVVTSSAQQAFGLLARLLVTPGRTRVAVENPGYPPLRAALAAAGAELLPVPVDDEGLCVERIPHRVDIVCVTPSHQSPTGAMLSSRRRTALLDFARRRGAVVIEDDYDGEFRFGTRPLDALQTLDRDCVFYVGTFSKTLFPGLRKGFVVAPAWVREFLQSVVACTGSHSDAITQAALAAFIMDGHMARHVRRMRTIYAERRDAVLEGLATLPDWLEPVPSGAGLHTAAWLRKPARAETFLRQMRMHAPGAEAWTGYAFAPLPRPGVVFGYGVIDAGEIRARMKALRRALA